MIKSMLLSVSMILGSISAFADGGGVKNCTAGHIFTGTVEQVSAGNCAGQWAIQLSDKIIVAQNLPKEYQMVGRRVFGCYEDTKSAPCIAGKETAQVVLVTQIAPDEP